MILSVPFAFGSCCCEPTSCSQRSAPCRWTRQLRNISSGQINSLVHSEKKRTHWWAQQHKKAWASTEDNSGGWSKDPLHGKENFTTSSQVKNTLQEVDVSLSKSTIKRRLHQSKYRGFTTRCKQGQIKLCQKTSKKNTSAKAFFGHLKLRSICTRMTGRKKYGKGLEHLMIQSIQHHLWNMVEQCDGMSMHGFQWHWVIGV